MEYFVGSFSTIIAIFIVYKMYNKEVKKVKPISINFTQSRIHQIVLPMQIIQEFVESKKVKPTQSFNHHKKNNIRILFLGNNAYWIKDNTFMVAELEDGQILQETAKPVDTMGMNKVELDKMIFIIDKLKEGVADDSGNSGK